MPDLTTTGEKQQTPRRDPTTTIQRTQYERLRSAVLLLRANEDQRATIQSTVHDAIEAFITRVERLYNRGEALAPDPEPFRTGVPPKS